jgi:predicted Zn-dependent protease
MADASETAAKLLALAHKRAPNAEARAVVSFGRQGNTRFAAGEITTAGATDIAEIALSVSLGKRHATATTSESSPAALDKLAERTLAMAKLVPEDPEHMPVLGPQSYADAPAVYDEATAKLVDSARAASARAVIELADQHKVIPAGFFQAQASELAIRTSAGLEARHVGVADAHHPDSRWNRIGLGWS